MRWKYVIAPSVDETRKREQMIAAMDAFWAEFKEKFEPHFGSKRLDREKDWELAKEVGQALARIQPGLMWEIGPDHTGAERRLAITSEGTVEQYQLIKYILSRAPKFPGWKMYDTRPPVPFDHAVRLVEGRGKVQKIMDFEIEVLRAPHNTIDLIFYSRSCTSEEDKEALKQSFILSEYVLGEEFLNIWRNSIKVRPLSFFGSLFKKNRIQPEQLKSTVDALIQTMQNELPKKPFDTEHWHPTELDPETGKANIGRAYKLPPREVKEPDFPFWSDMYVASSTIPALWEITHHARNFYDVRFSRCGETLAFLKIDRTNISNEDVLEARSKVGDVLLERLDELGIGKVYGGGTGTLYSYIELILTDVERAANEIRTILQELKVSRRSWLLFHDTSLYYEWIGIWDDTGVPPGLEEKPDSEE